MAWLRAAVALLVAGALGAVLVSGGSEADPRTPAALPGLPPPFLGTAVVGSGGLTAAVDAYGDVVDLRAPGPAGEALIHNPAARQTAGTVAADTGIVPQVRIGVGAALPFWRADSVTQRYLPGTNVVRTRARFGRVAVEVTDAAVAGQLARTLVASGPATMRVAPTVAVNVPAGARCARQRAGRHLTLICDVHGGGSPAPTGGAAARLIDTASARDCHWLGAARPLGFAAPAWARAMYQRSLLVLRALTDRRGGAAVAGARDGWAYVWPRDAGAVALAFAAAGYRGEARRIARFLLGLDLGAAARFHGDGTPVEGREAQGDAAGWVAVAARAADEPKTHNYRGSSARRLTFPWRDRADYQEGGSGDYLANALAKGAATEPAADGPRMSPAWTSEAHRRLGLVRRVGDPGSGLDSAAAWAVRPFSRPALYPAVRRTLLELAAERTRFGITPSEDWDGVDPWSAPTAWTAWSLAALGARREGLRLLGALRRAATPTGALPERVDARTGVPRSTTPLAWSHAFAVLALRQLWP